MKTYYSVERNVQILISLMKKHGIRKIIVSPGMTNICFVASVQQDPFFELYSVVDERSAAYMACGLAAESGEAVAISCTGATASRNYVPGLTEAFYRKLPVLAITSSQPNSRIGHNIPQVTDRRDPMPDIVKLSVQLPVIHDSEEEWDCVIKTNQALLELFHRGGGPVHINLMTMYVSDFSAQELGNSRFINRISQIKDMPDLRGKTAIFVGAHLMWSSELTKAVDVFCEKNDAVVLCDHTSNYNGKYGVFGNLVANQSQNKPECCFPDILIHIGDVSGAYMQIRPKEVWRVNPDGEIRDTFRKLKYVFEMDELAFFQYYATAAINDAKEMSYYEEWAGKYAELRNKLSQEDLPFSGAWAAMTAIDELPDNAVLHLGILNSLRCWNYFSPQRFIPGYSNTGGFGIDGCVSSMIGASLADKNKLFFGVVGDLAFFYDLNVLGNRNICPNIRILLLNNGKGFEFKHYGSFPTQSNLGDIVDPYIAAAGHNGRQSPDLVRHFAEDLGFKYISASNKTEFLEQLGIFTQCQISEKPILFELFTSTDDENTAQKAINNLDTSAAGAVKQIAKNILGEKGVRAVKKVLKK